MRLSDWLKIDVIAHTLKPSDELLLHDLSISFIEIIAPQIFIHTAITQQMIDNHQNAVSNRNSRFLCPSASGNATILGSQIGIFAVRSRVSSLNEELACIGIAFACLA